MIIWIPGAVIATITFPGVILHEMAHKFFCDRYNIPVYDVKYFAMSKHAGHVIHAHVTDSRKNAIIALAPLLINSVVCFVLLFPKILPIMMETSFVSVYTFSDIFLIWVGLSCGFNALPSKTDLSNIDKNISWPLTCIKRLVQILNFLEFGGNFIWLALIFIVPLLFLASICLLIAAVFA